MTKQGIQLISKVLFLLLGFVFCFGNTQLAMAQQHEKHFEFRSLVEGSDTLPYRFHAPKTEKGKKYPLVIFLHGSGERGNDNVKQLLHGVKEFVTDSIREKFPCYIIAPQCPENIRWVEVDWAATQHNQPQKPSMPMKMLMKAMDKEKLANSVDLNRIYVAGLSMGGFGTWDLITRYPEVFAAAIPVCGGADTSKANVVKCPVWTFHGSEDKVVLVSRTRDMVKALRENKHDVKYTEYKGVGHDSWTPAFKEKGLMGWLFSQTK